MAQPGLEITVLGAGVSGLSTALTLSRAGHNVKVVAAQRTPNTTSDVAAAFWYPFHVEGNVRSRAERTYQVFQQLQIDHRSGIRNITGKEFFRSREHHEVWLKDTWWRTMPGISFGHLKPKDVPHQFANGVTYTLPVIHMPTYMRYLERCVREECRSIENRLVMRKEFDGVVDSCDVLVNCTGLESRTLIDDDALYPCQGQVVLIKPLNFHELVFISTAAYHDKNPLYIVPRLGIDILLGGTTYNDEESTEPEPQVTATILERCAALFPVFQDAQIIDVKVGLRPVRRHKIEVDIDHHRFAKPVIHNYGHGGSGVTLSWGCAEEVAQLVAELQ